MIDNNNSNIPAITNNLQLEEIEGHISEANTPTDMDVKYNIISSSIPLATSAQSEIQIPVALIPTTASTTASTPLRTYDLVNHRKSRYYLQQKFQHIVTKDDLQQRAAQLTTEYAILSDNIRDINVTYKNKLSDLRAVTFHIAQLDDTTSNDLSYTATMLDKLNSELSKIAMERSRLCCIEDAMKMEISFIQTELDKIQHDVEIKNYKELTKKLGGIDPREVARLLYNGHSRLNIYTTLGPSGSRSSFYNRIKRNTKELSALVDRQLHDSEDDSGD